MPQLKVHPFNSYEFTEEELLSASILTPLQKCLIQSDIAQIAEQILNLKFDPLNPQAFAQDDAHQKGQLAAYRYLLLRSEESEIQLKIRATQRN